MEFLFRLSRCMFLLGPAAAITTLSRTTSPPAEIIMPFTLPPLPYPADALEPSIDKMTMEIHHDRHHKAYVDNVNKALESAADWQNKPIEEILGNLNSLPESIRTAVRNNGGGHANHTLFWEIMGP